MFKESLEGQTHSENDGCGMPEHNKPNCTCGFSEDTAREIGHYKNCPIVGDKTWWQEAQPQITCLSIDCPERKSVCCGAFSVAGYADKKEYSYTTRFNCGKCGEEFKGGKCTAGEKIKDWFEDCDWRKEFDLKWGDAVKTIHSQRDETKEFIETILIKILAKCETAKDAKECRHIIKDYILKDNGK